MAHRAVRLIRGYEETGESRYLDAAISLLRAELRDETADEADRTAALSNLGDALRCQFERTGDVAALAEAISLGRAAVTATPSGHRDRAAALSNLGNALRCEFERTGE